MITRCLSCCQGCITWSCEKKLFWRRKKCFSPVSRLTRKSFILMVSVFGVQITAKCSRIKWSYLFYTPLSRKQDFPWISTSKTFHVFESLSTFVLPLRPGLALFRSWFDQRFSDSKGARQHSPSTRARTAWHPGLAEIFAPDSNLHGRLRFHLSLQNFL